VLRAVACDALRKDPALVLAAVLFMILLLDRVGFTVQRAKL